MKVTRRRPVTAARLNISKGTEPRRWRGRRRPSWPRWSSPKERQGKRPVDGEGKGEGERRDEERRGRRLPACQHHRIDAEAPTAVCWHGGVDPGVL